MCGRTPDFRDLARHHRNCPGSLASKVSRALCHYRGNCLRPKSDCRQNSRLPCSLRALRRHVAQVSGSPQNYGTNLRIARTTLVLACIYLRTIERCVARSLVLRPIERRRLRSTNCRKARRVAPEEPGSASGAPTCRMIWRSRLRSRIFRDDRGASCPLRRRKPGPQRSRGEDHVR